MKYKYDLSNVNIEYKQAIYPPQLVCTYRFLLLTLDNEKGKRTKSVDAYIYIPFGKVLERLLMILRRHRGRFELSVGVGVGVELGVHQLVKRGK